MSDTQYVYSSDGRRGVIIRDADPDAATPGFVRVRFDDSPELTVPAELLLPRDDGSYDLSAGHEELQVAPNARPRPDPEAESAHETPLGS